MTLSILKGAMRKSLPLTMAVVAGYAGSALHAFVNRWRAPDLVRAGRFELIDSSGSTVAFWTPGPTMQNGQDSGAVLVFGDPRGVGRCEIGMHSGGRTPFLRFYGRDKAERVAISLGYADDPILYLSDRRRIRATLGAYHGDAPGQDDDQWGLSLHGRKEGVAASMGFVHWGSGDYQSGVFLSDGAGRKWQAVAGEGLKPLPLVRRR